MQASAARRRLAPQLLADATRRAEQALEAADVNRHEIVAVPFVPRRELLCDVNERARRRRRLVNGRRQVETRVEWMTDGNRESGVGSRKIRHSLMRPC